MPRAQAQRFERRTRAVDRPRAVMVALRLADDEAKALQTAADKADTTKSDFIRAAIAAAIAESAKR